MKKIVRNMSTSESRELWEGIERFSIEVHQWPAWKRAGINVGSRGRAASAAAGALAAAWSGADGGAAGAVCTASLASGGSGSMGDRRQRDAGIAEIRRAAARSAEVGYHCFVELIAQTERARSRIAEARSAPELRAALSFLADVAQDGASLCSVLRGEIELLGRPPSLATKIDQADAIAALLIDGLNTLAREAREQAQDATAASELRVGARNLVWFAHQVSWVTDELVRLREGTRDYHDRSFAAIYGDAERNAAEAALDANGEGSAVSFDLDQLALRG